MMEYLDILMFVVLVAAILRGYPASFTIAGVGVLFAGIGWATGHFDVALLGALGQRLFGVMTNNVLIAIPLFVFMGLVLEKNGIAEELLETMGRLFGNIRGGLGVSVILVGALLAASTGIVGATVVAMGMIAVPTMLRNGYDPRLASGMVCASGTLGQIIPPSTLLIILSDVMSNAYQQAQYSQGKFNIDTISVGQTFAAALIPGVALVVIYILYVLAKAYFSPKSAPAIQVDFKRPGFSEAASAIFPPVLLIIAVLGSILAGIASPSEAASVGAVGAVLLAGIRLPGKKLHIVLGVAALGILAVIVKFHPIRLQHENVSGFDYLMGGVSLVLIISSIVAIAASLSRITKAKMIKPVMTSTMTITAMIFATILMASVFSLIFRGLGGDEHVEQFLSTMPGGATGAFLFTMAFIFVLGFFLDFVEISVIVLPIVAPILMLMGFDPIWLSILIAINLQTSFLTPPFGFSLFYLRAAAPKEITTGQIYAGAVPFICLGIVAMALIWYFQPLATWLPSILYK
jgi:tripartite ATP-independent transporter DctM subunit